MESLSAVACHGRKSGIRPKILCALSIAIIEILTWIDFNKRNCPAEPDDEEIA